MAASCPHSSLPSPPAGNSRCRQKQVIRSVACRPVVCKQCYDTVSSHKYAKAVPCSSMHQAAQANQNHACIGMASTAGPRHVHSWKHSWKHRVSQAEQCGVSADLPFALAPPGFGGCTVPPTCVLRDFGTCGQSAPGWCLHIWRCLHALHPGVTMVQHASLQVRVYGGPVWLQIDMCTLPQAYS